MPEAARDPQAASGTLGVRLCNWVGEVVLALPTLRRLAAAGYALELIGRRWAPSLLEGTGWRVHARPNALRAAAAQWRGLRRSLPAAAPPAFLLTKSFSSALEARLGGWRPFGYARDARSFLLETAVPLPSFDHASHAYWHLASAWLGEEAPFPLQASLTPSAAQAARAAAILDAHGLGSRPFVVLCPFSGADDRQHAKVWPGFEELQRRLATRGLASIVCPGPGEEARAAEQMPVSIRVPDLDLGVYAALLARAAHVIANDTGPGHLAAAVGAPLVAVYGPRSVAFWSPLGPRVTLLHPPTGWPSIDEVQAALRP